MSNEKKQSNGESHTSTNSVELTRRKFSVESESEKAFNISLMTGNSETNKKGSDEK